MLRLLWAHTREIRLEVFQNKVVYDIPLGREPIFKNFKIEIKNGSIKLTTYQDTPQPHSLRHQEPSLKP
jgi:hypothetical protein